MSKVEWTNETGTKNFTGMEGFTYEIMYTDNTVYYGKKNFTTQRTLPPLKGYKRKRKTVKESNWMDYTGSSDWGNKKVVQKKTILQVFKTKGALTYGEVELLVSRRVLFRMDCLNNNISGRFYPANVGARKIQWQEQKDC